ncbi:MAG: TlyA family RNA methyltransferase [Clostridia bacterium]|nr:TlyA family RNA methyltransferase [Clostridia bacterium]
MRLDNELVRRNLFNSRNKSQEAIRSGIVFCNNKQILKPSFDVCEQDVIEIRGEVLKYVSRAGLKLEKAVQVFNINFHNKTMLDIGSSTGGFTDCALQMGVEKVVAVDVGSDVMDKVLRENPKIELYENTDFRLIDLDILKNVNLATIDVSFISVTKLIDKLNQLDKLNELVVLIKPQFECGKEIADKYKGIVNNKQVHKTVISNVLSAFKSSGLNCQGLDFSPIKGGSGNIEYISYFRKDKPIKLFNIDSVIESAFKNEF